jgi:hypothetical protein
MVPYYLSLEPRLSPSDLGSLPGTLDHVTFLGSTSTTRSSHAHWLALEFHTSLYSSDSGALISPGWGGPSKIFTRPGAGGRAEHRLCEAV